MYCAQEGQSRAARLDKESRYNSAVAAAMANLGDLYRQGEGVTKDEAAQMKAKLEEQGAVIEIK